jgi:hypothetical protein
LLLALAILIPGIPIAVGLAIGLQKPGSSASATTAAGFTPVAPSAAAPTTTTPAKPKLPAIPGGSGALVAHVLHATPLRASASSSAHSIVRLLTKTEFGSPEVLWVVSHEPGWVGVMAPQAGNGRVGWIAQSALSLSRESWKLEVSLGARRLTVLHRGRIVVRYTVAIGTPNAPTPTGRFAVTDRLVTDDPAGPYGCCILALSAHSPHAIQGWTGGTRIAIHSTPDSGSIGAAASHGCVRVTLAEGRWLLAHIPLGTPTLISS